MDDLSILLKATMRRRHVTAEAVAEKTGIRTPRVRAFTEDGAHGPVRPTEEELAELACALLLSESAVREAARSQPKAAASAPAGEIPFVTQTTHGKVTLISAKIGGDPR